MHSIYFANIKLQHNKIFGKNGLTNWSHQTAASGTHNFVQIPASCLEGFAAVAKKHYINKIFQTLQCIKQFKATKICQ